MTTGWANAPVYEGKGTILASIFLHGFITRPWRAPVQAVAVKVKKGCGQRRNRRNKEGRLQHLATIGRL